MLKVAIFIFALLLTLSALMNLYELFTKSERQDEKNIKSFLSLFAFVVIPWSIFYIICTDWFDKFLIDFFNALNNIVVYGIIIIVFIIAFLLVCLITYSSYQYAIEHKFIIWDKTFKSRFLTTLKSLFLIIIGVIIGIIICAILLFIILFIINFFTGGGYFDPLHPY